MPLAHRCGIKVLRYKRGWLFVPQGDERIDARRSMGGNQRHDEGNGEKHDSNRDISKGNYTFDLTCAGRHDTIGRCWKRPSPFSRLSDGFGGTQC